jgi:AraC-like DNA-binding protein
MMFMGQNLRAATMMENMEKAIVFSTMASTHDRASGSLAGPSATDPLSEVLRRVKLTGALFFLVEASSPWGMDVPQAGAFGPLILPRAQHIVSYHIVLKGEGYAALPGAAPVCFGAGDVIVFPHADAYAMASEPGRPVFDADQTLQFFRDMAAGRLPFKVKEGGEGPERAEFVCGFLGCDARPFNPLLAALPRLLHMRRPAGRDGDLLDSLIELTLAEARMGRPGAECIRLGLSELIFIEVVRRYLSSLEAGRTGWLAGLRDPVIGRVLALMHERPAHPWTLEELAGRAAMSRSVLADRFLQLVGHPPMHYLTLWRVQLAAGLLADGAMKVAAVAAEVGYASEAAFSRTFKRIAGVSPAQWRKRG